MIQKNMSKQSLNTIGLVLMIPNTFMRNTKKHYA